jgi:hypothetical protein
MVETHRVAMGVLNAADQWPTISTLEKRYLTL